MAFKHLLKRAWKNKDIVTCVTESDTLPLQTVRSDNNTSISDCSFASDAKSLYFRLTVLSRGVVWGAVPITTKELSSLDSVPLNYPHDCPPDTEETWSTSLWNPPTPALSALNVVQIISINLREDLMVPCLVSFLLHSLWPVLVFWRWSQVEIRYYTQS